MKILVVFYSRTGTTKKLGQFLAEKLGSDIEEIKDSVDRSGARGYIISGRDAMRRKLTKLQNTKFNSADYDLVVIGTPIWGWNMSVPVRTYIAENVDNFKKIAFFCTMGGSGDKKAFREMETVIGKKPVATLALLTRDVAGGNFEKKAQDFILNINNL